MVVAWENLQEVFVMLVVVAVVFTSLEVFHFIAFQRHPSPFRELLPGFYTHFILSAQLITEWFFSRLFIFYRSATVLSGPFLSTGVFYPTLLRFWLRCGQEHPIQDLPLCLPSQSCPFRLMHGLELLMFELQVHWFIDWASEPRSIQLKSNYWICFACSKSYVKTIKIYFGQGLDLYCL